MRHKTRLPQTLSLKWTGKYNRVFINNMKKRPELKKVDIGSAQKAATAWQTVLGMRQKAEKWLKSKIPIDGILATVSVVATRELEIETAQKGLSESPALITMTELSQKRGFSTAAGTGSADQAEKLKLIKRVDVEGDRRKKALMLTAKGWKLMEIMTSD